MDGHVTLIVQTMTMIISGCYYSVSDHDVVVKEAGMFRSNDVWLYYDELGELIVLLCCDEALFGFYFGETCQHLSLYGK